MALKSPRRIESKEVALTSTWSWVGSILLFVFGVGFFLLALFKIRDIAAIVISGFFAAWGVVGIVMMMRAGASQQRYGPLPIELEEPPTVGGRLRASLRLPAAATRAPLSLSAVLTCSKVTYGEQGSRMEEPLQGLRKVIAVAHGSPSGARATFDFEIPPDLPHANDPGAGEAVPNAVYGKWELKVDALGNDTNLSRSYDIPVGRAPQAAQVAAPPSGDGPIEIVRPGARVAEPAKAVRAAAPPAATRAIVPPEAPRIVAPPAAAGAGTDAPPAPGFVPEDDRKSLWVLVAINLIPLAGVMFAGWRVHEVVFLYWIENLVIGVVNVLRMRIAVPDRLAALAKRGVAPGAGELFVAKAALIGFFILHYGGFCYGHGTFLAALFPAGPGGSRDLGTVLASMLRDPAALVAIIGIVLSHAYSYFHNYIGRGEYLRADLGKMMFTPYKRIVVTHLFIFAGAFALQGLGSPVAAMLAFIGLKIAIDAYAHRQERRQLAASG